MTTNDPERTDSITTNDVAFRALMALAREDLVLARILANHRRKDGWTLPDRTERLRELESSVSDLISDLDAIVAGLHDTVKGLDENA